jgi:glycosyltransferase involved in cell wall biosynthesis
MRRRLKILFFPARYPSPSEPGLATIHREYARAIALYHDVVVLDAPREEGACNGLFGVDDQVDDGVRVVRVRFRRSPVPKTTLLLHVYSCLAAYRQIVRSGFRPDLIHGRYYFTALAAVVLGKVFRVPVVLAEGSECFSVGLKGRIRLEAKFAMNQATVLVSVSETLRRLMEAHGIRGNYKVVPNPVDTRVFYPARPSPDPGRPRRLLTVARLMPVKGFPNLLQGVALLQQSRTDFSLDIIGDGSYCWEYESLARTLGLQRQVTFLGPRPRAAVADYMRQSRAFVLASVSENCPSAVLEALASGLPIVASDIPGIREVVPDDAGVFFPKDDPKMIADSISSVLDNLDHYDPAKLAAYAQSRFGAEVIGKQFDQIYRNVLTAESTTSDHNDSERGKGSLCGQRGERLDDGPGRERNRSPLDGRAVPGI